LARNWFGAKTSLIPYKFLARQYFSLLLIANQVSTLAALPKYWYTHILACLKISMAKICVQPNKLIIKKGIYRIFIEIILPFPLVYEVDFLYFFQMQLSALFMLSFKTDALKNKEFQIWY